MVSIMAQIMLNHIVNQLNAMKKTKTLLAAACVSALLCTSCNTLSNMATAGSDGSQSLLESLITGVVGNVVPINETSLAGTWKYSSPEVRFESESALAQAGGAVAANTIESKLAEVYSKVGIKSGACSFTFNADKTCSITLGSQTINGTYTINSSTHELNITSNTGLIKLSGTAYLSVNTLTLLFDADKLMKIMQTVATVTGGASSTISTLSTMLNNYDGALIGMNLKK